MSVTSERRGDTTYYTLIQREENVGRGRETIVADCMGPLDKLA
jgi:hypothetical protein